MRKIILVLLLLSIESQASKNAINSLTEIEKRCPVQSASQEVIYEDEFHWRMSLEEIMEAFGRLYQSPKRLDKRAYFDSVTKTIRLPYVKENGGDVLVPLTFVHAIQNHIEQALQLRYADAVIFPDLGHSHYLIPLDVYESKYNLMPVSQMSQMYTKLFKDPGVKIVYHTAEQLVTMNEDKHLVEDPYLQWRHFTRNLVGELKKPYSVQVYYAKDQSSANTLNGLKGYYWWGSGFNVSANKDGCFKYYHNGKTFGFDISLYDLAMSSKFTKLNN